MRAGDGKVLLVVDFKNQLYKSSAAHAGLFHGRVFTGGLYGFMVSVLRAVRDVRATAVVVATDTPPYRRKEEFDVYKSNRAQPKAGEDDHLLMKVTSSVNPVLEFLDVINAPFWRLRGFEYDDICAWAARRYEDRFDRVLAQTNDSDLFQMFDCKGFGVYRGAEKGVYTKEDFVDEWGDITRDEWIWALSLMGTHNAVPGVTGIGPKTALKALKDPALRARYNVEHKAVLDRNRRLIELPHADFPEAPRFRVNKHRFQMRDFVRFASKYDIAVTGKMVEALADLRFIDD